MVFTTRRLRRYRLQALHTSDRTRRRPCKQGVHVLPTRCALCCHSAKPLPLPSLRTGGVCSVTHTVVVSTGVAGGPARALRTRRRLASQIPPAGWAHRPTRVQALPTGHLAVDVGRPYLFAVRRREATRSGAPLLGLLRGKLAWWFDPPVSASAGDIIKGLARLKASVVCSCLVLSFSASCFLPPPFESFRSLIFG